MKLRSISLEMVGLVSAVLLGIAPVTHADDRDAGRTCSNKTLKGFYGFYRNAMISTLYKAALCFLVCWFGRKGSRAGAPKG